VEASNATGALVGKPKLEAWLKTIHARPAYQVALDRGGPYALA
jgi:glutathione S-transferase